MGSWRRPGGAPRTRPDGFAGIGTIFDTVGHGERGRMSYRVTEVTPRRSYAVTTHSGPFREAHWLFRLEEVPLGTQIYCATIFRLRRRYLILAPLLWWSAKRGAIKTDLGFLKRVLEAE